MGDMSQVVARAEHVVRAPVDTVREALADYEGARRRALTEHFSDYRVEAGGHGSGTRVHWRLAATRKRVREQLVEVTEPADGSLVERDTHSSMVTTWTVHPADAGVTTVRVRSSWSGAGGGAGFFRRTFAPPGPARIYTRLLAHPPPRPQRPPPPAGGAGAGMGRRGGATPRAARPGRQPHRHDGRPRRPRRRR